MAVLRLRDHACRICRISLEIQPLRFASFAWLLLVVLALPVAAVTIDGNIEPGEWKGARHITDFRQTQPLTGKPAIYPIQAWILATPKGLAVAMRVSQPPGVPRTEQHVEHDFREQVDRVNVDVDFTGSGRTGYNFTVASTDDRRQHDR
ncbi:MAG: hypothetical protein ACREPK_01175 [Rhodanobacteraceae bacterium]